MAKPRPACPGRAGVSSSDADGDYKRNFLSPSRSNARKSTGLCRLDALRWNLKLQRVSGDGRRLLGLGMDPCLLSNAPSGRLSGRGVDWNRAASGTLDLSLPKSQIRAYRWCSPPRIG